MSFATICSRSMKMKALSELEQEVMNIVWECGDCSVRDVLERINKKKKLAYTTIATILQRLYDKGIVVRTNKDVIIYYSPKLTKENYSKSMARSFIAKFFNSFGEAAIASFAESIEKLPRSKKEYLLKLLSEKHETK